MFELLGIKQYDTHHRYGTDWHFDYVIKTDEKITSIDEVVKKLKEIGQNPSGQLTLKILKDEIILETIMF